MTDGRAGVAAPEPGDAAVFGNGDGVGSGTFSANTEAVASTLQSVAATIA